MSFNENFNPPQEHEVVNYQNFVQSAPDYEVDQVHQDYFNQMPKAQRMGLFSGLMDALGGQQAGFDPRQAGVSTTDPRHASPTDLGNLFNYARNSGLLGGLLGGGGSQTSQGGGLSGLLGGLLGGNQAQPNYPDYQAGQPGYNSGPQPGQRGGLQDLLNNPLAQAALSGLISYAANRAINGWMNRNNQPAPTQQNPDYNYPPQANPGDNYPPQANSGGRADAW